MVIEAFSWLHLTDFHYGLKGQDCLWPNLRQPLLDDLADLHDRTGPWQAVLFTGDIVQSGRSAEFEQMQPAVLDRVWKRLDELGSGNAMLLAVPGNHDLYRPDPSDDNAAVDLLLARDGFDRIAGKFWGNSGSAYRRVVHEAFAAYSEWWGAAPNRPDGLKTGILPGDFACTLEHGALKIGIVGLNTAFLQLQGGDYQRHLVWNARQLHVVCGDAVDDWLNRHHLSILLTHQGPDWLTPEAREHGESEIAPAGRFALHLFGHMHETDITYVRKGGAVDPTRLCQGRSAFGLETFGDPPKTMRSHGYTVGRIEFNGSAATLRLWPRVATKKTGPWRFIPDHENAHLQADGGTVPEAIAVCAPAGPATRNRSARRTTGSSGPNAGGHKPPTYDTLVLTPHSTLPARRAFFGRTNDLETIAAILRPDHVGWGVVLDGPGGIGKTALAVEAAYRAPAEHYPLKLFVTAKGRRLDPDGEQELEDHRVDDYPALLSEIGVALGRDDIPRAEGEKRPTLVRHALATHRALIVLDNLESFTPRDRRRIYELLEFLPRSCRALVTSRRRDDTAARTLRLDKLEPEAVDQLFDALGERSPSVARLTAEERQRLYAETGGNPLLLTWTAGQLGRTTGRCQTVAEAVARLQEAHRLQKVNDKNDPLEFVFGDLLDTFTADETKVLAALAHFSEPARLEWLLPLAKLSEMAALTALDDLRNRALLIEDETAGTWLLPPLAARFIRQRRPEAFGDAGERLAERAYALVMQHGGERGIPFTELSAAWPIVRAALPLLIAGDNERLQRVCDELPKFLEFRGHWDEWHSLSQDAEAKALASADYYNAGWRAKDIGYLHSLRGAAEDVLASADRCARHFEEAGAGAEERSMALGLRGHGFLARGDFASAIAAYERELALCRSASPKGDGAAGALNSLGSAKLESGDLDGAEADVREGLRIARKKTSRELVAVLTGNLTEVLLRRQSWASAELEARDALELSKSIGRQELIAADHMRLARALLRLGRAAEALDHMRQALDIFTELRSSDLAQARALLAECEAACSPA